MLKLRTNILASLLFLLTNLNAQWSSQIPGISGMARIDKLYTQDGTTVFACGSDNFIQGNGVIYKSVNGGQTWSQLISFQGAPVEDIFFTSATTGYAVGSNGLCAKTVDGGNTWITQYLTNSVSGSGEQHNGVFFSDQNTGFIVGGFNVMTIYKTVNAGVTWNELTINLPSQRLNDVYFIDANNGYAVGGDPFGGGAGRIYNTKDGGLTWDSIPVGITNYYNDITFVSSTVGYIACANNDLILKTSDGGDTWTAMQAFTGLGNINELSFYSNNEGYACSNNGKVAKTIDGSTWTLDQDLSSYMTSLYTITCNNSYGYTAGFGSIYGTKDVASSTSDFIISDIPQFYPNPSNGMVFFTSKNVEFSLYNNLGTLILNGKSTSGQIDLTEMPKGLYYLKMKNTQHAKKIVLK